MCFNLKIKSLVCSLIFLLIGMQGIVIAAPQAKPKTSRATRALIAAVKEGDFVGAEDAIHAGADVNVRIGKEQDTPLMLAMRLCHEQVKPGMIKQSYLNSAAITSFLAGLGMTLTANRFGRPARQWIAVTGVAGLLVGTVLLTARTKKHINRQRLDVVKLLAKNKNVDVTLRNKNNQTALDFLYSTFINLELPTNALIYLNEDVVILQNIESVLLKKLSAAQPGVTTSPIKITDLIYAIHNGDDTTVRSALSINEGINMSVNEFGDTPLIYAIKHFAHAVTPVQFSHPISKASLLLTGAGVVTRFIAPNAKIKYAADLASIIGATGVLIPKKPHEDEIRTNQKLQVILVFLNSHGIDLTRKNYQGKTALEVTRELSQEYAHDVYVRNVLKFLEGKISARIAEPVAVPA